MHGKQHWIYPIKLLLFQALRAAKRSTISNQFVNNQNGELKFNPSTDTATVLNGGPQNTNAFEKKFFEVNSIYFQF